jgi:Mg2+/Co2+ transporter CorB
MASSGAFIKDTAMGDRSGMILTGRRGIVVSAALTIFFVMFAAIAPRRSGSASHASC